MISSRRINLNNKKIAIIGIGETGQGAAFLAKKLGANVLVSDSNEITDKTFYKKAHKMGINLETGGHSNNIYNSDLWILSPGISDKIEIVKNAKNKGIEIVSEIEFASWFTDKPIIAVTGTNGKTTTVSIINDILNKSNLNPVLAGNIGFAFSKAIFDDLFQCDENRVYVLELSSFQLEYIYKFKPFISILLNISPDHQDRYDSMESYIEAKMKIAINHDAKSYLVYNSDDSQLTNRCKNLHTNKISFGLINDKKNILKIDNSHIVDNQAKIVSLDNIALKGKHNLSNILAAASAAKILKVPNKHIAETLSNFRGIEHRLERVETISGVTYYNDSKATNVDSVIAAIDSFKNPIILILGGKDKDNNFSSLSPFLKKNIKKIVSYGEARNKISIALRDAVELNEVFSLRDAVEECRKSAVSGDIVLLSPGCASFDQFNNYEHRGNEFKKMVKNVAYA